MPFTAGGRHSGCSCRDHGHTSRNFDDGIAEADPVRSGHPPTGPSPAHASGDFVTTRRIALAAGGATLLSSLGGCLGALGDEPETVTFGTIPAAAVAEIFIADALGFFEERNIELEIERIQALPGATPQLASGHMDVATGAIGASTFNSIAQGLPITIVADQTQWWTEQPSGFRLLVREELYSDGMSFTDLENPTISFFPEAASHEYLWGRLLAAHDRTWDDVEVSLVPFTDMLPAMDAGEIDLCTIFDPLALTIMDETGAGQLMYGSQVAPRFQIATYVFGGPFMEERPAVAVDLLEAYLLGVREYYDMGGFPNEDVATIISEAIEIPTGAIRSSIPSLPHKNGRVHVESIMSQQAFHACRGYVDDQLDADQIVDESFLSDALEGVGRLDESAASPSTAIIDEWSENAPRPYLPVGETVAPASFPTESICE